MKKLKIVPRATPEVDNDCYRLLTKLQRAAKRGEINGVLIATVTAHNSGQIDNVGTAWAGVGVIDNCHASLGALEYLKTRFVRERFDD